MESSQATLQILPFPSEVTFPESDDAQIEQGALSTFFDDYCVESTDRTLSRGFLDGLKPLIVHAGQSSDVAQAAKIVALSGIANRMGRPGLVHRIKLLYIDLLGSFKTTLSNEVTSKTIESLMTAVMLGIYEVWIGKYCAWPVADTFVDYYQH